MTVAEQQIIEGVHSTLTTRVEFDGANTYKGSAAPGTAESEPGWRISRIYESPTTGNITILWAGGDNRFANVWADRASLAYS
jgi:hypothetical protein